MEVLATLALALGASWCAGINLYATVFVLGAMSRWTGFELPADLLVLENPWVIGIAAVLYTVEFFADKIPAIDTAWDTVQTFIRIPAGAVLAAMSVGDVPMAMQVIALLLGGTLATTSHTTKATARIAAHSSGTSPVVSPSASVAEDVLVIGLIGLIVSNPVLALLLLAVMIVASVLILWVFWKVARKLLTAFGRLVTGQGPDPTPA